jgi:hypothetical protein
MMGVGEKKKERNEHLVENCTRIVGGANGSGIYEIQNNRLTFHLLNFHFLLYVMSQSISL